MPPQNTGKGPGKGPSLGARRLQILQYIVTALRKLAASRGVAIVILSQCATKMQAEGGATLIPAINAGVWEQGISNRVVLYRDFVMQQGKTTALHFAGIEKKGDKSNNNGLFGDAAAFKVEPVSLYIVSMCLLNKLMRRKYGRTAKWDLLTSHQTGLVAASFDSRPAGITRPKRKLDDTDFEVADSDEEDYGWQDDAADALPPMPSQWQGSEDIIVGAHRKEGHDSEDEDEGRDPNDEIPASDDDDETESIVPGAAQDDALPDISEQP